MQECCANRNNCEFSHADLAEASFPQHLQKWEVWDSQLSTLLFPGFPSISFHTQHPSVHTWNTLRRKHFPFRVFLNIFHSSLLLSLIMSTIIIYIYSFSFWLLSIFSFDTLLFHIYCMQPGSKGSEMWTFIYNTSPLIISTLNRHKNRFLYF